MRAPVRFLGEAAENHEEFLRVVIPLVLAWAGMMRAVRAIIGTTQATLDPDVVSYLAIARNMSHLFDTRFREPGWIWLVKLFDEAFQRNEIGIRVLGAMLFAATCYFLWTAVWNATGRIGFATIATLFLLSNDMALNISIRGLRDALTMLLFTICLLPLCTPAARMKERRRRVYAAVWIATTALSMLSLILPVMALSLLLLPSKGISRKWILATFGSVVVFLVVPSMAYWYSHYGDPLHASNVHAIWWRNYEFRKVRNIDCSGCPSQAEYQSDPFAGDRITTIGYLFGLHSPSDLIRETLSGFATIFLDPRDTWISSIAGTRWKGITFLYLAGLATLLLTRWRTCLLIPLAYTNFLAFLVHLGPDPRLVVFLCPWYSVLCAIPIVLGFSFFASRREPRGGTGVDRGGIVGAR